MRARNIPKDGWHFNRTAKQAQPGGSGGVKKAHDHLQPHLKGNRAASKPNENDEGDDVKNVPTGDDNENDGQAKSEKNKVTGDSDKKVESEYQSEGSNEK